MKSTDFIQQYIFPGGLLPCPSQFEAMAKQAGLVVEKRLAFGRDYAETFAPLARRLPEPRSRCISARL